MPVKEKPETNGLAMKRFLSKDEPSVRASKTRDALITNSKGETVFEQKGLDFPVEFSDMAVNIVASKYFFGKKDSPIRENSFFNLADRVVDQLTTWGQEYGYFRGFHNRSDSQSNIFRAELYELLVGQAVAFNSPVWFNCGVAKLAPEATAKNWHWDSDSKQIINEVVGYSRPQCSACFINSVEDSMESILDLAKTEGMLFKYGSGAGVNLSPLRSSNEQLAGGGIASGPLSFMRGFDAFAGVIKSGGTCLAPYQPVFTDIGVVTVKELAEAEKDFITLSKDKVAGRIKAKTARAWKSGTKQVVQVVTDKGEFHLSFDHPMLLTDGTYRKVIDLTPGMSLSSFTADLSHGHVRIGLQDGKKGKEFFHRLIAQDVLGYDPENITHHADENKFNNAPENLIELSQSEHASIHGKKLAQEGKHVFQNDVLSKAGTANGMHAESAFWSDEQKSGDYRSLKSAELVTRGDAAEIQKLAVCQKMINTGYKLINSGHDISTFAGHLTARRLSGMKVASIKKLSDAFNRFGSYESYYQELRANNHKVESINVIGVMDVYDIEVDCPSPDDKSENSSHNFAILPIGSTGYTGKGVFVSNTRRAAKMVVLNAEHPDIEDFIVCKGKEEKKAHALMREGYDGTSGPESEAYLSIAFQNANNSVRATDEFMYQATSTLDTNWPLKAVKGGHTVKQVNAREILLSIAQQTWECGDPGMQWDTTINDWHTCKPSGRINASNPCSEYMFLDDSACNLASFNLLKFYENGKFNVVKFKHAVRILTIAMDIIVDGAGYPTEQIAKNSHDFRPLGLGFANLGALLMEMGLPYDSDEGRHVASLITAVMGGQAYLTSAELAQKGRELAPAQGSSTYKDTTDNCGAFPAYQKNKGSFLSVIDKHVKAAFALSVANTIQYLEKYRDLANAAYDVWNSAEIEGKKYGFRNSQVTVLAPTGTIGFMMDCDTTGIEPMLGLITYKKMVGGGYAKLLYPVVERTLEVLEYNQEDRAKILQWIEVNGTVVGSEVKPEHYPVFDCALTPAGGGRSISWQGHAKMMAACQPFLSGAISKTINMPESATVQDIFDAYVESWRLGIKAVAIYRDGSKKNQVMVTSKDKSLTVDLPSLKDIGKFSMAEIADAIRSLGGPFAADLQGNLILPGKSGVIEASAAVKPSGVDDLNAPPVAVRHKLADTRSAVVHKFEIAGHEGYLHVGLYPDGEVGEIFVTMAKEGSTLSGIMDAFATSVSLGLQHGVPLKTFIDKLSHTRFEPSGWSHNPAIGFAKSIMDYIFRWLALEFVDKPKTVISQITLPEFVGAPIPFVGIIDTEPVPVLDFSPGGKHRKASLSENVVHVSDAMAQSLDFGDAPACSSCGAIMARSGSCYRCLSCGDTSGCS